MRDINLVVPSDIYRARDYMEFRSSTYKENIVVSTQGHDVWRLNEIHLFADIYSKEYTTNGWVVLYPAEYDMKNTEQLIADNLAIFRSDARLNRGLQDKKINISFYGADFNTVNSTITRLCGINVSAGTYLPKLSFVTQSEIALFDLCMSYPLILGVNGISMQHIDGQFSLGEMLYRQ